MPPHVDSRKKARQGDFGAWTSRRRRTCWRRLVSAATSLRDLSPLKSVGLHKLSGGRKGQWSMTVNGPWRVCFRFKDGDAHDVELVDYHKG